MRRQFLTILFCALSFNIFGAETFVYKNNERLSELLKQAIQLEDNKHFDNAIIIYNKALKIASEELLIKDISFIYKKIGLIYYKQKYYKKASEYFKKSISKNPSSKIAADSYFNLCLTYRKQKVKDSLFWALNNSLELFNNLEDSDDKFSTYSKAGILFKQSGRYDIAMEYLLKSYDWFSVHNNIKKTASITGNIANIQGNLGNTDISKVYYREHLKLSRQLDDSLKLSFAYNNLANLFYKEKVYDSALVYYEDALKLQKAINNQKNIGKTLSNIGITYFKQENLNKSKTSFQKGLVFKKQAGDTMAIAQTLNELALISIRQFDFKKAKKYLDSFSLYLSSTINSNINLRHNFVLGEYYKNTGDYKRALEYKKLEFEEYKTIFSKEQSETIQRLQEQFESQLKEQQISELSSQNSLKDITISVQNRTLKNKNLLLLICGLLFFIFLGFYFYIKQRQKVKLQILENKKLQAVLAGQEHVKNHISKDLHDIITTSYDGIRLKILALTRAEDPKSIQKTIIEDIKNVNHEIRLISHRLSPLGNKIKQMTLTEIIISQLSEFQHYRKIFVDIQLPLPDVLNQMTLDSQTNFYGILLEILNNIEKHSKANEVVINHSYEKNVITFTFCDNGIGLTNENPEGIGIMNIQQRTFLLKGDFKISNTERGTCLKITFPIKENIKNG